jgi:ABC-type transporter Mla subunit MlaD
MFTREVRIGLTVLAGVAIIYLSIAWARRIHLFAPNVHTYEIHFDTVAGLLEGDVVNVRGYPAGRVRGIFPQNDYVQVVVALDQTITLYQNAQAEIQIKEIMGGKQVSLLPGDQPPALAPGGRIQGKASLDISSSFSQVGKLLEDIDQQALTQTSARLDHITQQLEAILLSIDPQATGRIITNLDRSTTQLQTLTEPLSARRIDQTWTQIDRLLAHADGALLRIDTLTRQAEAEALPRADTLLTQLSETLALVNGLASDAQRLAKLLDNEETLIGQVLHDPTLPGQVDTLLNNLNATLKQIQDRKIIVGFRLKQKKEE